MRPSRIRRRRDGVIEIRRRRLVDLVVVPENAWILGLLLVFATFLAAVCVALVISPILIATTGAITAVGLWGAQIARSVRVTPAPAPVEPPPRRVA